MHSERWPARDVDWPGDHWPGYFTRTLLHLVQPANAQRISTTLGLADCGATAIRPSQTNDYHWCTPCPACFPPTRSNGNGVCSQEPSLPKSID